MIHQRATARELFRASAGVLAVLFSVLMTTQVIRLLGQAAGGKLTPDAVLALLGFTALSSLPVLLAITLFLGVLLTFSRWYRDSEMVVWQSAGMPLSRWLMIALKFSAPVILIIAVLSLFLTPWAAGRSAEIRHKMEHRDDIALVTPGAFNESASADRVFFVESLVGDSGAVRNIFVSAREKGQTTVIATALGRTETAANGDQYLVLESGRRYDIADGSAAHRMMEFERYGVRLDTKAVAEVETSTRALPTAELIRSPLPKAKGELVWRVGVPLSAVILVMLAVPLSFVNPRAGRAANLIVALLLYTIYNNLLGVSQVWVAQSRIGFLQGLLLVHLLMLFALGLLMLYREGHLSRRRIGRST